MFKSISDGAFSEKNMFCNGLICLNRNTKWNNFYPTLLLFVFWTDAKRLVLNWLFDSIVWIEIQNETIFIQRYFSSFSELTRNAWFWIDCSIHKFYIFVEENAKLWNLSDSSKCLLWKRRNVPSRHILQKFH